MYSFNYNSPQNKNRELEHWINKRIPFSLMVECFLQQQRQPAFRGCWASASPSPLPLRIGARWECWVSPWCCCLRLPSRFSPASLGGRSSLLIHSFHRKGVRSTKEVRDGGGQARESKVRVSLNYVCEHRS